MNIQIRIRAISNKKETDNIYIPQLNFVVDLCSADSLRGSCAVIGSFGVFYSIPLFFIGETQINISIPINTKKFDEMRKIRAVDKLVSFLIKAEGIYLSYDITTKQYGKFNPISFSVLKNMPDGSKSQQIILTTEEFIEIARDIGHFEIYRLEIPVSKMGTPAERDLQRAIDLMLSAKNNLIQNNYSGALLDIRNALSNHLLERREDKNVIREEIRNQVLKSVPSECEDIYNNVLNKMTTMLNSLLQDLHIFVHEDSDKLKLSPLPQDVETIYFTTIHIIKYLASYG